MIRSVLFLKLVFMVFFFSLFFILPVNHALAACITADFADGFGAEVDSWQIEISEQLSNMGTCLGSVHNNKYFIVFN